MPIYDRNKDFPDRGPYYWLDYIANGERVRESAHTKDEPRAKALLKIRLQEVADRTWVPAEERPNNGRILFAEYFKQWHQAREDLGVQSAGDEHTRMLKWVLPHLGDRPIENVRRKDLKSLIAKIRRTPSETTGELLANRSIHRIYEVIRQVFRSAVEDELLTTSPATLRVRKDELPKKTDKDPHWRSTAVFARDEVEQLICDKRIPLDRRVLYALLFLTGARFGEIAGLKWRSYDNRARPLGRITLATQYEGRELKTGIPREVPVHPTLAVVLEEWRREGWESIFKRAPKADDWMVPRPTDGKHRLQQTAWNQWSRDLGKLGLRHRRIHDTRRTVVTLARADGAREDLLQWVTHGPSGDRIMDVYTSPPWASLCAQINCLDVQLKRSPGAERPAEPEPRLASVSSNATWAKEDLRPSAATELRVELLEPTGLAQHTAAPELAEVHQLSDARPQLEQQAETAGPEHEPQADLRPARAIPQPLETALHTDARAEQPASPRTEVHVPRLAEVYRLRSSRTRYEAQHDTRPASLHDTCASGNTPLRTGQAPIARQHRTPQPDDTRSQDNVEKRGSEQPVATTSRTIEPAASRIQPSTRRHDPPGKRQHLERDQNRPPQPPPGATVSTWGTMPSDGYELGLGCNTPGLEHRPRPPQ